MRAAVSESRLPVGSSPTSSAGSQAIARAIATRCCSPPDSSDGTRCSFSPRPTSSRFSVAFSTRWRAVPRRANSIGNMAFSSAVSVGSSWKNWNTIPTRTPRQAASSSWPISSIRRPSTTTRPLLGRSMPVTMLRIVDLPLPDDPTIETISPCPICRSTPRSAGNSTEPVRYDFSTPTSSMSGPPSPPVPDPPPGPPPFWNMTRTCAAGWCSTRAVGPGCSEPSCRWSHQATSRSQAISTPRRGRARPAGRGGGSLAVRPSRSRRVRVDHHVERGFGGDAREIGAADAGCSGRCGRGRCVRSVGGSR